MISKLLEISLVLCIVFVAVFLLVPAIASRSKLSSYDEVCSNGGGTVVWNGRNKECLK